jgi:1-acyl-sn-glycerol-3-phosphate acyltransferase
MIRVRAVVFNTLYYGMLIAYMLLAPILFVLPWRFAFRIVGNLARNQIRLQRLFGIDVEVRGREWLPTSGGLVAAKHQAMWETFALIAFVPFPAFVYKRELGKIPLFGAYLRRFRQIPVDRGGGSQALKAMAAAAHEAVDDGRQVIIFPEGTRKRPGAEPDYKYGIARLYEESGLPVTPVALNSGLIWSNFFWTGHRGRIVVDVLPPIAPGLTREAFLEELRRRIETRSDALILEAARSARPPPLTELVRRRIERIESGGDQAGAPVPAEAASRSAAS